MKTGHQDDEENAGQPGFAALLKAVTGVGWF
jgi:hypothetical protein